MESNHGLREGEGKGAKGKKGSSKRGKNAVRKSVSGGEHMMRERDMSKEAMKDHAHGMNMMMGM